MFGSKLSFRANRKEEELKRKIRKGADSPKRSSDILLYVALFPRRQ
jgi:hypothetical protein